MKETKYTKIERKDKIEANSLAVDNTVIKIKYGHLDKEKFKYQAKLMSRRTTKMNHILDKTVNKDENGNIISVEDSPIVAFKQIKNQNYVYIELQNGISEVIRIDDSLQLYFDKMERFPDIKVDFGTTQRDRVEVIPQQNKIAYVEGVTGKTIAVMALDSAVNYQETDPITGNHIDFGNLNTAVVGVLSCDKVAQKDFINRCGNIDLVYNFGKDAISTGISNEKLQKHSNISTKELVKKMHEYYKHDQEYVEEQKIKEPLSRKVGYANLTDKISSTIANSSKKAEGQSNLVDVKKRYEAYHNNVKRRMKVNIQPSMANGASASMMSRTAKEQSR